MRFSQLSLDPESGILGYQVRLRTQAGIVLRDWPQGATVDLPTSTNVGVMTPVPALAVPFSGQLVAEVRAVNGAGVGGNQAASGPITVDGTAPPQPTVTFISPVERSKTGSLQFRVSVTASADPETGFGGLEVRVDDAVSKPVPWTAIPGAAVGNRIYTIALPAPTTGTLTVMVRARNGIGMYSIIAQATIQGTP